MQISPNGDVRSAPGVENHDLAGGDLVDVVPDLPGLVPDRQHGDGERRPAEAHRGDEWPHTETLPAEPQTVQGVAHRGGTELDQDSPRAIDS